MRAYSSCEGAAGAGKLTGPSWNMISTGIGPFAWAGLISIMGISTPMAG